MQDRHRRERQEGLTQLLAGLSLSSSITEPNSEREPIFGAQGAKSRLTPTAATLKRGTKRKEQYKKGHFESEFEKIEKEVNDRGLPLLVQFAVKFLNSISFSFTRRSYYFGQCLAKGRTSWAISL
jgi:hypothetical protein